MRFDKLTPAGCAYTLATAELGEGPHRSGHIAAVQGRQLTSLGPTRAGLIDKGVVYTPAHGDTAFTVPLSHHFQRRVMPDWQAPPVGSKGGHDRGRKPA